MIMAKKQNKPTKTCADCIHENACRAWVDGRYIADESANRCPNYETVKESGAYLCGVLDERKRKKTNADRIRAMSDEKMAEFIQNMVDGSNNHNVACYGCINYGTHHSNPANKGTYLYECEGCTNEGIGLDVLMWLQQPAEETDNAQT